MTIAENPQVAGRRNGFIPQSSVGTSETAQGNNTFKITTDTVFVGRGQYILTPLGSSVQAIIRDFAVVHSSDGYFSPQQIAWSQNSLRQRCGALGIPLDDFFIAEVARSFVRVIDQRMGEIEQNYAKAEVRYRIRQQREAKKKAAYIDKLPQADTIFSR